MAPQALQNTGQERRASLVSVDGRTYPLRSAHVRARAEGGLAKTTLIQEFANPHDEPLEVIYTMPLPADGAVLGYTIRMGERVIRGEIEVREAAEARYREALYAGHTAGLLEQDRVDTFQQRLGNLPPHTDVQVEIEILHPLSFLAATGPDGPVWEYRFPTVVGVRYEGAQGRVPDADRLEVDRDDDGAIPTRFGLELSVADRVATLTGISSSSHEIVCVAAPDGVNVTLAEDARLDRDLVLRWAAATDEVGVRVVEGRGHGSDDGRYALITLTPPKVARATYSRDLTVLIDASGSMGGPPIAVAKAVVEDLLGSLDAGDRFEVVEFANSPRSLTRGLEEATEKKVHAAIRRVREITAGGATEMWSALDKALASLRPRSQRQIVLVTDGQIGFEREVVAKMGARLPSGVRVHVVGIGAAPNRSLTASIARAGRGVEVFANDGASVSEAACRLRAATERPVLTDLRIGGTALRAVAPEHPRDVLEGQPLILAAELRAEGGTLEASGRLAGSKDVWVWRIEVPATGATAGSQGEADSLATTPLPIGALYGREVIADLEASPAREARIPHVAVRPDIDGKIEALGLRHRITSRRTSLVAIAEEPTVDPLAPRRRERLAVELPAGISAEGVGLLGAGFMDLTMLRMPAAASRSVELSRGLDDRAFLREQSQDSLRMSEPTVVQIHATLVRLDATEMTLEIAVPPEGLAWPQDGVVRVSRSLGNPTKARLVPDKSTPGERFQPGTLVRMTLRIRTGGRWPEAGHVILEWGTFRVIVDIDSAARPDLAHE